MYAVQTLQVIKTVIVAITILINVIIVAIKIQVCAKNAHTKKQKEEMKTTSRFRKWLDAVKKFCESLFN